MNEHSPDAPPSRPRVKICGVTTVEDALLAVDLGADFIGLNFVEKTPRHVTEARAAEIVRAVRGLTDAASAVIFVGVFVNLPIPEAVALGERVGLDLLQFHGDEAPEDVAPVAAKALKAFRVKDRVDAESLGEWLDLDPWGLVIDSRHPSLYGGSGETWDVSSLNDPAVASALHGRRVLIAGGLDCNNVTAALDAAKPWGIDLCSGIEAAPGKKDPARMRRLFEEIRYGESSSAT